MAIESGTDWSPMGAVDDQPLTSSRAFAGRPAFAVCLATVLVMGTVFYGAHVGADIPHQEAPAITTLVSQASSYYLVMHTFKFGMSTAWWGKVEEMMKEGKASAVEAQNLRHGFWNPTVMPISPTSLIYCIWEAKAGTTGEELQTYIDKNIGMGMMNNLLIPIDQSIGFKWPAPSKFASMKNGQSLRLNAEPFTTGRAAKSARIGTTALAAPLNITLASQASTYYLVMHNFRFGTATAWWKKVTPLMKDPTIMAAKALQQGFYNSVVMPISLEGPIYCLWEARAGTTGEELQTFIDKEIGMGMLENTLMPIDQSIGFVPPSPSKFGS